MQTIQQLSSGIISSLAGHLKNETTEQKEASITMRINWFMEEIFKLIKHINESSLNDSDREKRLNELKEKFGIPINHLL